MSKSGQETEKPNVQWLETFKTMSTFTSTLIIAFAGIFVTNQYNARQLEIARNRELSGLIPQLGDSSENVRKFTAVSLSLYGKEAVPALVATLNDSRPDVSFEAERGLTLIGDPAVPVLLKTYSESKTSSHLKAMCLITLGELHANQAGSIAMDVIQNKSNNNELRGSAAKALGLLKDKNTAERLVKTLLECQDNNVILSTEIMRALGQIKDVKITPELLGLVHNKNEDIRRSAVWMLAVIGDESILSTLENIRESDPDSSVHFAARDAASWFIRNH